MKTLSDGALATKSAWRALFAGLLLVTIQSAANATPGFARQTGMACAACHSQNFPALNEFGRSFKSSGYNMVGAQPVIEGDDLNLPSVLNASLITKLRYQITNGTDKTKPTNDGELQIPDEAALLLGGRVGKNMGYLAEISLFDTADSSGAFSLLKSFKIHFNSKVGDADVAIIPFMTDAGGAGYGFELLNTGAYRFGRLGEDRSALMAQQYLGLGAGAATGVAFVYSKPEGFANLSLWAPTFGNRSPQASAHYLRAALTPNIGGWDTGFGFQYYGGASKDLVDGVQTATETKGLSFDAQAQGVVNGMPLNVYASYGRTPGSVGGVANHFNSSAFDKTAFSVHAQMAFTPKISGILGYRTADLGTAVANSDIAYTVGANYMLAQNMQLQVNHVQRSGSKFDAAPSSGTGTSQTTLMLFSAF